MSKVIVIGDPHAQPKFHNERAEWIGQLIVAEKPDEVICIGDLADMISLCSYDKGQRGAIGRSYAADIASAVDFNDRMMYWVKKAKKRKPKFTILEGNHEERIERALNQTPELEGTIAFKDLQYDDYYDEVIRYDGATPGVYESNGVHYAHYFSSGAMGRPIGGEHVGYSLLAKKYVSCTVGHDHKLDYCIRTRGDGQRIMGLGCGGAMDFPSDWAGQSAKSWWNGVIIKDNVENGTYDLRCVSMGALKKEYAE